MNCEKCAEDLTSLVFDELSDDSSLAMHEHLAECDACRDNYLELIETQSSLESVLTEKTPESGLGADQKKKILEAVDAPSVIQVDKKPPMVFPSWLFAAAACLIIGVIFFKNSRHLPEADLAKTEESSEKNEQQSKSVVKYKSEAKPKVKSNAEAFAADKEMAVPEKKAEALLLKDEALDDQADAPAEKAKKSLRRSAKLMDIKEDKKLLSETTNASSKGEELEEEMKKDAAPALNALEVKDAYLLSGNVKSIAFTSFEKMLAEYSETKGLDKDILKTVKELQTFKKDQLQLTLSPQKGTKNTTEQKILVRILDNAKKAIDYAHVFVHNQKIIRVERVR